MAELDETYNGCNLRTGLSIKLKICNLPYLIGTFHPAKFDRNIHDDVSQPACVLQKMTLKLFCLLTLCAMAAVMQMTLQQGRNMSYKKYTLLVTKV